MLLFVGLGNPGSSYVGHRHNIGFMAVQAIAKHHGIAPWRRRFQGVAVEGTVASEKLLLLLPGTYMNESGRAVGEAANFYKLDPGAVIVLHDEVELPLGKMRVKVGGGNAGHNGLRSISEHIGNDYRRVRIGVGRPGHKDQMQNYVLQDFAKSEQPAVETICDFIAENVALLVEGRDSTFLNKGHLTMVAKGIIGEDDAGDPD